MSKSCLGEYVSLREGLSELESRFLSMELAKHPYLSASDLRRIAKHKAFGQRVKWLLQDIMYATCLAIFTICITCMIILWGA